MRPSFFPALVAVAAVVLVGCSRGPLRLNNVVEGIRATEAKLAGLAAPAR